MVYYTVMAHGRKVAEFKPLPFCVFIPMQVSYIHIYIIGTAQQSAMFKTEFLSHEGMNTSHLSYVSSNS